MWVLKVFMIILAACDAVLGAAVASAPTLDKRTRIMLAVYFFLNTVGLLTAQFLYI